jgi:peptidoglycan/xylan/chitin deacetylase (PgdA/CDA1 family)
MFLIVTYHHVVPGRPDGHRKLFVSRDRLREHCLAMSAWPVATTLDAARAAVTPTVVVTFDDGYRNFADEALPVLAETRTPATLFASTGKIGHSVFEPDYGCVQHYLDTEALRLIDKDDLVQVESHGHSHRPLTGLGDQELAAELAAGTTGLAALLGRQPRHFCYPYGDHDDRVVAATAAAGYQTAVTCIDGNNTGAAPALRLCRIAAEAQWTASDLRSVLTAYLGPATWERR